MNAYYDTSALIRLYVLEDHTAVITKYVADRKRPVAINGLHELELENGLRSKIFRGEITDNLCHEVFDRIAEDVRTGLLVRPSVNWHEVFQIARRLSSEITARSGCRSLDILHLAVAVYWSCPVIVSFDDRQIKAARLAHMQVFVPR